MLSLAGNGEASDAGPRPIPPGLLPVAFDLLAYRVELLDLSGAEYSETFFHQTVERWRRERPAALRLELSFAEFYPAARLEPGREPAGFIFHVGRGGSTLLANMLAVPHGHLVLKEPQSLGDLLSRLLHAIHGKPGPSAPRWDNFVRLIFGFIGRPTADVDRRLILKFSSWTSVLAARLLRLFPNTPAIFLYREPEPVVASMLATPPGFQNLLEQPRDIQARFFPSLADAPPELAPAEFYAHVWRSTAEPALALPPGRVLFLSYNELVSEPEEALRRVLGHLELRPDPDTRARMLALRPIYAKDPAGRAGFDPAAAHRRPPLDASQRAAVARVVGELPARLEERRLAQRAAPAARD